MVVLILIFTDGLHICRIRHLGPKVSRPSERYAC